MKLNAAFRLTSHKLGEKWIPGVRGYHNAAGCMLMAADTGLINLQFRSADCDTPHTWGMWGGSMDRNEEPAVALRRELAEECGYTKRIKLVPLMVYRDPERGFVYHNYLGIVPKQFNLATNWETEDQRWFSYDKMPKPLHPGLQAMLKDQMSKQTIQHYVNLYRK